MQLKRDHKLIALHAYFIFKIALFHNSEKFYIKESINQ